MLSLLFVLGAIALPAALADQSFTNLVTFGDSYTDVVYTGDGGVAWPAYAASYANATLYPFAFAGATCSNEIAYSPWFSVSESQIPWYLQKLENGTIPELDTNKTLHSLWIGTNDLGVDGLLTGSAAGNLVQVTACMAAWVKTLYEEAGARNFILQNVCIFDELSNVSKLTSI